MEDDLCWFSFLLWFGVGGRSCSNFLASTVTLRAKGPGTADALRLLDDCSCAGKDENGRVFWGSEGFTKNGRIHTSGPGDFQL